MTKPWFLYMIECVDGSIYTGITVDVEARYGRSLSGDRSPLYPLASAAQAIGT